MSSPYIQSQRGANVLFVATYPPEQCGIATFTRDLADAVRAQGGVANVDIVAISHDPSRFCYPREVVRSIRRDAREDYRDTAAWINRSTYSVVCVQHEFGIFGGEAGEYLLDFLRELRRPVVSTLHTVLADPAEIYLRRTRQVVNLSDAVVGLTPHALTFLEEVYGIERDRSTVVPHGIPALEFADPEAHKPGLGFEGRTVMMTFGLIGPSKGIEDVIEGMPTLVERHPDLLYVIVGATHPGVLAVHGESYREGLQRRVEELGLADNVCFVNRYLENDELYEYLRAADIYVTPYPNRDQISSGTLAYAAGLGKAIVATRFWYAVDLLGGDRGMLVDFRSPEQLSRAIGRLLDDPTLRSEVRRRAYEHSRAMVWDRVGNDYVRLFGSLGAPIEERRREERRTRIAAENVPLRPTTSLPSGIVVRTPLD